MRGFFRDDLEEKMECSLKGSSSFLRGFTPLEKATDKVGGGKDRAADGGLMPPSAETVREQSSLTGFTPLGRRNKTGNDFSVIRHRVLFNRRAKAPCVKQADFLTAFTLVELLLVVIIIGVLAAMVIPRLTGRSEESRRAVAKVDIDVNIPTALKLYELDNGVFPTTDEGLNALLSASGSATNWKGPYLEKKPTDPWGNTYQYRSPGTHRTDYDLYSLGRDGVESDDDVNNWEE